MTPTYLDLCQITKSDAFHSDKITYDEVLQVIGSAIVALQRLDAVKKTLFYGRKYPEHRHVITTNAKKIASDWMDKTTDTSGVYDPKRNVHFVKFSESKAIDVIHAILGVATESGEMLELLNTAIRDKEFDSVNFSEEMFDGQWYNAIGCAAIGMTFEQGQATNIAKLQKRFGPKFDAFLAENRDLSAERATLESAPLTFPKIESIHNVSDAVSKFTATNPASVNGSTVYEAIGAASMCWNPRPEGIFDSEAASAIAEKLCKDLRVS